MSEHVTMSNEHPLAMQIRVLTSREVSVSQLMRIETTDLQPEALTTAAMASLWCLIKRSAAPQLAAS
jgi:hypothetical protein